MDVKPIGGYFGWEFPKIEGGFPHEHGTLLNSGHHALQYLLQHLQPVRKVYIAYYTCDSVEWPLKNLNLKYEFYHVNKDLEIAEDIVLQNNEYIIYTNYFGLKEAYIQKLKEKYGRYLIIDNAQAFYAKDVEGCYQIYSPRKYVGCPDGGIIFPTIGKDYNELPQSKSYDRCAALLQRSDDEVSLGYKSFQESECGLEEDTVKRMSVLTNKILTFVNHATVIERRRTNFNYLHSHLKQLNNLSKIIDANKREDFQCPMIYPFYAQDSTLRDKLIENKIFVARYWPNVLIWCKDGDEEYELASHIIALPIDQRYDEVDMNRIVDLICK